MPPPLISTSRRVPLLWVIGAAAVGFAALALAVAHRQTAGFDSWIFRQLYEHVGAGVARALLDLSLPAISLGVPGLVAVLAALRRRWDVAALAVAGPGIAVLLAETVFKPLVGPGLDTGYLYGVGAFPSGHEAGVASASFVLLILAYQPPLSRAIRVVTATVLGAWIVLAAAGLVRNVYHTPADTVGAILLCGAVVPAVALVIDAVRAVVARRAARREMLVRQ